MSGSNGTATPDRIAGEAERSNGSVVEQGAGVSDGIGRKPARHEGDTRLLTVRRSKAGLAAMGVIAVAMLIAGVLFPVLADSEAQAVTSGASRVLAVQTVSIEPVNAYQTAREYTGTIVARRTSQLGFESEGKLVEITFDEGDSITMGTALARLDTERLETARLQAVARRAQAAAKLDEMVAGPRDEDIDAANSRVASLQAQVELLELQAARQERLAASNATSQNEYEQYIFGLKDREAQLDEARHNLEELLNGTRTEQIEAQRAVVAELDAAIADIDVDLRKSVLVAPYSGTIARRLVDEGTVVDAGQPVFRLVEDQVLEAWIGLPVHAAEGLDEESKRQVRIDGRHFNAVASRRFPEVDPVTRTRTVVLRLDDSAAQHVVHGQVVRLQLNETVEASGYWLPSTALTEGARGLWESFVVVKGDADPGESTHSDLFRVERREVEVLHTESDRVLVRGTLNPGDRVVTGGTHRIVPGQLVRLTR